MDMEERAVKELGLYFHIPFCERKCSYCDFLSAPGSEQVKRRYMEALLAETAGCASLYWDYTVDTVFLGGGTPSVVPVETIERLMDTVRGHYHLGRDPEVSMEVNPGTVSCEMLARLRQAGINRLSIGLQSADDGLLAALGRIHTWEQFQEAFRWARRAGFENINVDVMSALPGQTLLGYLETLERVLGLDNPPEHISAYSLILEEGTPLYEKYGQGLLELPDEDTDRLMYQETKRTLADRGYHRYEISNYARKGCECRHNCGCWRRKNYVGFGIGAASLVENVRFRNGGNLGIYMEKPLECREEIQRLSRQEQMEETMFLGLRMVEGVDPQVFERQFGQSLQEVYGSVVNRNIRDGLLEWRSCGERPAEDVWTGEGNLLGEGTVSAGKNCLRLALTERGLDLSSYVMSQFLLEE